MACLLTKLVAVFILVSVYGSSSVTAQAGSKTSPDARMSIDIVRGHFAGIAMLAYAEAHHGFLPDAAHWEEAIRPYWGKRVPFSVNLFTPRGQKPHRLAMNKNLSCMNINRIERYDHAVMLYETVSNRKNAISDPSRVSALLQSQGSQWLICYADGRLNLY